VAISEGSRGVKAIAPSTVLNHLRRNVISHFFRVVLNSCAKACGGLLLAMAESGLESAGKRKKTGI